MGKKRARFTGGHEPGHLLRGLPESEGAESLCHASAGLIDRIEAEREFERIKAYVSTEKRYTVTLKEDS